MGFFSSATFNDGSAQFEAAAAGAYVCRLANVESIDRPSYDDPNVMVPNFRFTFETTEYGDTNGNAFRFVKFTRQGYGNDKQALTLLLDGMLGRRLTQNEFHALDIDTLMSKEWMVAVDAKLNTRGYMTNAIVSVSPVTAKKKLTKISQPTIKTDDIEDPFGEDASE
jgi:hypothetical protein